MRESEIQTPIVRELLAARGRRFLKGPIPMAEIATAARLPGRALALYLAVRHQADLTGNPVVTLPRCLLEHLGIDRDAKARGLRHLEGAALIRVTRSKGSQARITLQFPSGSHRDGPEGEIPPTNASYL